MLQNSQCALDAGASSANGSGSDLTLNLAQPLLRGFGSDVNRANIVLARNARRSDAQALRGTLIGLCADVEAAYWTLVVTKQGLLIQARLLVSGEILDHRGYLAKDVRVWAELRKGVEPDSDVLRIKSTEVYANWGGGPNHNNDRKFIRAANAPRIT